MNMKTMMITAGALALVALGLNAAESIRITDIANHYPWDGKIDCVFVLGELQPSTSYDYQAEFTLKAKVNGNGALKTAVVTNDLFAVNGTTNATFDVAALFGEGAYPCGTILVKLIKDPTFVQLWANGPYWAKRNVGAAKPHEAGCHFAWGETNGYRWVDNAWHSIDGTATDFFFLENNCPTYNKDKSWLTSNGYIDADSHLTAAHDAATAVLGAPWRMPTSEEFLDLCNAQNTSWQWVQNYQGTGVNGYVVSGKGAYAGRFIFLPAAGMGGGNNPGFKDFGTSGFYWSSTSNNDANSSGYTRAVRVDFVSGRYNRYSGTRSCGHSVRPLRETAE